MNGPQFNPYNPNQPPAVGPPGMGPNFQNSEEKVMAAVAHASILVPPAGLIVPLILWLTQMNRSDGSRFAAFQAKQAFLFQLSIIALEWIVILACFLFGFVSLGVGWLLLIPILGLGHLGASVLGIIAAVESFNGRDYRYPILGPMLSP